MISHYNCVLNTLSFWRQSGLSFRFKKISLFLEPRLSIWGVTQRGWDFHTKTIFGNGYIAVLSLRCQVWCLLTLHILFEAVNYREKCNEHELKLVVYLRNVHFMNIASAVTRPLAVYQALDFFFCLWIKCQDFKGIPPGIVDNVKVRIRREFNDNPQKMAQRDEQLRSCVQNQGRHLTPSSENAHSSGTPIISTHELVCKK